MGTVSRIDDLRGSLDILILKTLTWGPRHGYGILQWLEESMGDQITIEEGSLYPALYRLEIEGAIAAQWGVSEQGRKAKFYRLTRRGRSRLRAETKAWNDFVAAMSRVLSPARTP
jgi:PadR family transcriptional regulator, regulatory protein PadR